MEPRKRTTRGAVLLALLLGGSAALTASWAHAQGASPRPSDKATARILGTEGLRLAEAGDCEAAIDKLKRAEALFHAPTTLGRLGECQVLLGRLVAGTENLQRVVREPLPQNASPAFLVAKERAQRVLDESLPKIAVLVIHVDTGRADVEPEVKVDGEKVPSAILGAKRPTDPGDRVVEASGPYCDTATERVQLAEGAEARVDLRITCREPPKPPPAVAGEQPPGGRATPPAAITSKGSDDTIAYVALGVGGAGVVAGTVFGLMAMGEKSSLKDVCDGDRKCPSSAQSNLDNLDRYAMFSNIGFGVGLVGVGVGTTLLLMSGEDQPPASDAGVGSKRRPSVDPWLGLGSAGVAGTF
jgi:hypothetical protein